MARKQNLDPTHKTLTAWQGTVENDPLNPKT